MIRSPADLPIAAEKDVLGADIVLHQTTKAHVAQFVSKPVHALLLTGNSGIGKTYLARTVVAKTIGVSPSKLDHTPYFRLLGEGSNNRHISIDSIRELQKFTQLKTSGDRPLRRAVVVEHAQHLTIEAQNAFLKLLEEPPEDTLIVLTATRPKSLLPTILSRVQTITVLPPGAEELKEYFLSHGRSKPEIDRAYLLSGGLPGLMSALLGSDATHPLVAGIETAKDILQMPLMQRLCSVDSLCKQKDEMQQAVEALQRIACASIDQAVASNDCVELRRWQKILKATTLAHDQLLGNASAKLVLSNMMLNI